MTSDVYYITESNTDEVSNHNDIVRAKEGEEQQLKECTIKSELMDMIDDTLLLTNTLVNIVEEFEEQSVNSTQKDTIMHIDTQAENDVNKSDKLVKVEVETEVKEEDTKDVQNVQKNSVKRVVKKSTHRHRLNYRRRMKKKVEAAALEIKQLQQENSLVKLRVEVLERQREMLQEKLQFYCPDNAFSNSELEVQRV